jgi:hypothetical protein
MAISQDVLCVQYRVALITFECLHLKQIKTCSVLLIVNFILKKVKSDFSVELRISL